MNQRRRLKLLRLAEQIGLTLLVISALITTGYLLDSGFEEKEILIGTAVTFLVGLLMFTQAGRVIQRTIEVLVSQTDFATNEQFLSLFERSPVAYVTTDKKGKILKVNQAGVQLLNGTIESLTRTNFLDRFVASEDSDVSIIANKIKAGITLNDVQIALRPDESDDVWVLLSSYMNVHTNENFISLVNVTQAKKVDEAKSEFVALATHQLRTPIAAIRWNVELLKKRIPPDLTDTTTKYFEKVNNNIERMASLINDFLNVSKLELGTFAAEKQFINLRQFIDAALDEFADKVEQKFIKIERIELPSEFSFNTDVRLIQIIISNLLSNAVKYVNESGTIWVTTNTQEHRLVIQIADNGIGIPENEIGDLFTKFYRASNAKQRQTQGTGLGLYIVKQAVEQLGGTISVMSNADKGAAFTVSLPLSQFVD